MSTIDDFQKIEMKIGRILSVEKIPDTDKLLKLSVDLGEKNETGEPAPRTIVSGIALYFPDWQVLVGKRCVFVSNLEPRMLRGVESNGMIMTASDAEGHFSLLEVSESIPLGTRIK